MAMQYQDGYYFDLEAFQREYARIERMHPPTIIYRSGRRPGRESAPYHIPPFPITPSFVTMFNAMNLGFIEAFSLPAESLLRGPAPESGYALQLRLENLRQVHLLSHPRALIIHDEICPSIPSIDPDAVYARRRINGGMLRHPEPRINKWGQSTSPFGLLGFSMSVVKATRCYTNGEKINQPIPDWDWKAMQNGENWCAPPRKHWTERIEF